MPAADTAIGIDVGAARLHLVALRRRRVIGTCVIPAGEPAAVTAWVEQWPTVRRVAVDAPSGLSVLAHADDESLSRKFRAARCGEVALGRDGGVWVPWVSPPVGGPVAAWMAVGLATFAALLEAGFDAVETYPHAVFRALAEGEAVPAKSTPAGIERRAALLTGAGGVIEPSLPLWSHDGLDACAAAVVAADPRARALTCGHDGSAIWLPSGP